MVPWLILRKCIVIKIPCLLGSLSTCHTMWFFPSLWLEFMLSCYLSCLTQQMKTSLDGEPIVTPELSKTVICLSSPSSLLFISTKLGRFEGTELCICMNCVYSVPSQEDTCGVQRLMSGCLYLIAYPPYFLLAHLHKLANEPLGSACLCCVWICRQGLVLFLRLLCG